MGLSVRIFQQLRICLTGGWVTGAWLFTVIKQITTGQLINQLMAANRLGQLVKWPINQYCTKIRVGSNIHHHHHHHLSLNREGRWGTTDDSTISFLHFSLFSTALWDLANSRLVHSLMLSSHLFLYLPCLPNILQDNKLLDLFGKQYSSLKMHAIY